MILVDGEVGLDYYDYSLSVPSGLSVTDSSDPLLIMLVRMTEVSTRREISNNNT